jgi:hypothetical protein
MNDESQLAVERQFDARIDTWVRGAVADGDVTFPALLERLPGVYPSTALASVTRLGKAGQLRAALAESLHRESALSVAHRRAAPTLLPLPHPLDFEWRFTSDTCFNLLELSAALCPDKSGILLLGTPAVALTAMSHSTPPPISFWGDRNRVTERVIALNQAMRFPIQVAISHTLLPAHAAGVVVVDPPWYLDYIRPMFAAASAGCEIGGHVVASLPPEGAMANAISDREATIKFARYIGLELVKIDPLSARYDTPFFEHNSLAACGIRPPPHWRRGDVLVFRKFAELERAIRGNVTSTSQWSEVEVDRTRLFIKRGRSNSVGSQGIIPILPNDILPTVSRRDRRRTEASIWTSGNRIFASDNIHLVLEAALSYDATRRGDISQRSLLGHGADKHALERVVAMLADIVALETSEEQGQVDGSAIARRRAWTSDSNSYLRESTTINSG